MKSTRFDNLYHWGVWQPDRRIDFNGFFWTRPGGNVLIDPMELGTEGLAFVAEHGGAAAILLSGWDHFRATAELKERFGCTVLAPAGEKPRFGDRAGLVDTWFESSAQLGAGLDREVQVHLLRGGKSPVEACFYLEPLNALCFGDLVRSHASGKLILLPDAKLSDRGAVLASLAPLRELPVEAVLLGDGDSLFTGAQEAFRALLERLG